MDPVEDRTQLRLQEGDLVVHAARRVEHHGKVERACHGLRSGDRHCLGAGAIHGNTAYSSARHTDADIVTKAIERGEEGHRSVRDGGKRQRIPVRAGKCDRRQPHRLPALVTNRDREGLLRVDPRDTVEWLSGKETVDIGSIKLWIEQIVVFAGR